MSTFGRMIKGMMLMGAALIGAAVTLIIIVISTIRFGAPFVVAILSMVTVFGLSVVTRKIRHDGGATVLQLGFKQKMYQHECASCTDGTQTLGPDGWGPIPEHHRMVQFGSRFIHAPVANDRPCQECGGMGSFLLPYPPKKIRG